MCRNKRSSHKRRFRSFAAKGLDLTFPGGELGTYRGGLQGCEAAGGYLAGSWRIHGLDRCINSAPGMGPIPVGRTNATWGPQVAQFVLSRALKRALTTHLGLH